jgi:hypothetical protein
MEMAISPKRLPAAGFRSVIILLADFATTYWEIQNLKLIFVNAFM